MAIYNATGLYAAPITNVMDPGLYLVTILSATPILSKVKATPGIEFEFTVEAGPDQASGMSVIGRKFKWTNYTNNLIGLGRLKKMAKLTEVPIDADDNIDLDLLVGKTLIAKLKHKEYMGETSIDIADFRAAPGSSE